MPKKTKSIENKNQPLPESSAPAATKKNGKRQSRRSTITVKKPRKPASKKETAGGTTQISASLQAKPTGSSGEPSDDEVRLRAYFISERRRRFALSGDADSDWLEARRQLLAEGRR